MEAVIEINSLSIHYKTHCAVDGLSFDVKRGEIFGFLGPNGAGKSSTIKAILGLVDYHAGEIKLHGLLPSNPDSRRQIGYLPEEANYYRFLTPTEILTFYGQLFEIEKDTLKNRVRSLLDLVGMSHVAHRFVGTFSKGMTQKISLAQALINEPQTLILDEPTSGLDPLARTDLRNILTQLKSQGKTIFFSSHELSEVELLCDSIAIIRSGKLVRQGSIGEVLKDQKEKNLERFFVETIRGAA